jgi:hypothetical protein
MQAIAMAMPQEPGLRSYANAVACCGPWCDVVLLRVFIRELFTRTRPVVI